MTSSAAMNIQFLHGKNLPFLRYIHCNFCLNLHITHRDMEENVSGCFFLNTVYVVVSCNFVVLRLWTLNTVNQCNAVYVLPSQLLLDCPDFCLDDTSAPSINSIICCVYNAVWHTSVVSVCWQALHEIHSRRIQADDLSTNSRRLIGLLLFFSPACGGRPEYKSSGLKKVINFHTGSKVWQWQS